MASFLLGVRDQLFASDLTGQTTIVTGANVGLGLEAACHFTRLGAARVIHPIPGRLGA